MKKFMNHSKILFVLLAMCFSLAVAGCQNKGIGYKVIQDRVIELTYDTFDGEKASRYVNMFMPKMGACSAVKVLLNDKVYVGRNYDFYCSKEPAVIVRNNAGKIRTIGIANVFFFPDWTNAKKYKVPFYARELGPYLCCDVMSEAGIYAETNIRSYEKGLECSHTNKGKPRRCTQTFMQTMLTQYSTIDEILSHIDDYDWYDLQKMDFEQAFLLADKTGRSVVIEFGANAVHWQEADAHANFFLDKELYELETLGCGELRLEREFALKDSIKEEKDIRTMMEAGRYGQFYEKSVDIDFAIPEFYEDIGYNKISYAKNPEEARSSMKNLIELLDGLSWDKKVAYKNWETVFFVTANVTDLTLDVRYSEHYNIDFKVKFE